MLTPNETFAVLPSFFNQFIRGAVRVLKVGEQPHSLTYLPLPFLPSVSSSLPRFPIPTLLSTYSFLPVLLHSSPALYSPSRPLPLLFLPRPSSQPLPFPLPYSFLPVLPPSLSPGLDAPSPATSTRPGSGGPGLFNFYIAVGEF